MNDLKTTHAIVHEVLKQDERARNSDSFLYFRVIGIVGMAKGIDVYSMKIAEYLLKINELKIPPFETVRRTRQKIQHDHPELAACKEVNSRRMQNEEVFREYALEGVTEGSER